MKRKHKKYSKPRRPFDKARIEAERLIIDEFGLKNKKEIWKAEARIKEIRERAKKLISAQPEEQKKLFARLQKIGLKVSSIGEVLSLTGKDWLKRRLQTVLVSQRLAKTPKSARQLISHRKVLVDEKAVDSPSYIVPVDLEYKITLKVKKTKSAKKITEEAKENEEQA